MLQQAKREAWCTPKWLGLEGQKGKTNLHQRAFQVFAGDRGSHGIGLLFSLIAPNLKIAGGRTVGLETLTSLNKEVRLFSYATIAFGVFPLLLPLAITAFGGPEGCSSLEIIAFGTFERIVPKYYYRLGKWTIRGK